MSLVSFSKKVLKCAWPVWITSALCVACSSSFVSLVLRLEKILFCILLLKYLQELAEFEESMEFFFFLAMTNLVQLMSVIFGVFTSFLWSLFFFLLDLRNIYTNVCMFIYEWSVCLQLTPCNFYFSEIQSNMCRFL